MDTKNCCLSAGAEAEFKTNPLNHLDKECSVLPFWSAKKVQVREDEANLQMYLSNNFLLNFLKCKDGPIDF